MKGMFTYDLMESARNTNEWLGATARAMASYPAWGLAPHPFFNMIAAWGEVTERSFGRMIAKPDWGIRSVVGEDGRDHILQVETVIARPFGNLIHFKALGRSPRARRVLLVAPMSGHYATLMRSTVASLLPDCEVYVTDWNNARDIPVSEGKFDIEDYTLYLVDFMKFLGPDINVIAVCQPAPLTLAATAYLAEQEPAAQPATLVLIGGPIDPDAALTDVTDFGRRVTMGQLEQAMIQRVGFKYRGAGRLVYPGLLQLQSFISMNMERHGQAFFDQMLRAAKGQASDHDHHNRFYDEYLAVMDMTAEFYLSTVERIFKRRVIARNVFTIGSKQIDIGKITEVAVMTVEGEKDDISAPGQCVAALKLCTGLDETRKANHLEPGAGHYGIFAGRSWRDNIRPLVLKFIDDNARPATEEALAHTPVLTPAHNPGAPMPSDPVVAPVVKAEDPAPETASAPEAAPDTAPESTAEPTTGAKPAAKPGPRRAKPNIRAV